METGETTMPATSRVQQRAAGAALAAKRGDIRKSELVGASRQMYASMTAKELEELAGTRLAGLPERKSGD